jgi:hypothetical protein
VSELRRRAAVGRRTVRGRCVASLIWLGTLPRAANDNRTPFSRHRLLPMAATLALLSAAAWAVLS